MLEIRGSSSILLTVKLAMYHDIALASHYFRKQDTLPNRWLCQHCPLDKSPYAQDEAAGHIQLGHTDPEQVITVNGGGTLDSLIDKKSLQIYKWLNKFVECPYIPLSACEDPPFLKDTTLERFEVATLRKWLYAVAKEIERKKREEIWNRRKFPRSLIFNTWDDRAGTKYIAVFIAEPHDLHEDEAGAKSFLLCLCPLDDETSVDGDNQIATITGALRGLGLTWDDIVCITADNTGINLSLARKVKKPLVGCKSHVLALAVKSFLQEHSDILDRVQSLMKSALRTKIRGKLRDQGCVLAPILRCDKWDSAYLQIQRFLNMEVYLVHIDDPEIQDLMLSGKDKRELIGICESLKNFTSCSKVHQRKDFDLADSRALFDQLLKDYDNIDTLHHLRSSDPVVSHKEFLNGTNFL